MLFVLDGLGVPSEAEMVQILDSGPPPPNSDPVLTPPSDQVNDLGDNVFLQLVGSDPDGDSLSFSAVGLPAGLNLNQNSGLISGTPTADGSNSVTVTVEDGQGGSDSASFSWIIEAANSGTTSITIIEDAQPNSNTNFRFGGQLGVFRLDDPNGDDGDAYQNSQTFEVAPGTYRVTQQQFNAWVLTDVACNAGSVAVELNNSRAFITIGSGENISCTFTNERKAEINARKANDLNGDGKRSSNEPWMAGWEIQVYSSSGDLIDSHITDNDGRVKFRVAPGNYTVCEVQQTGWINTKPTALNPTYGQPCYEVSVAPQQAAWMRFFNSQSAAGNNDLASSPNSTDVIYSDLSIDLFDQTDASDSASSVE